MLKIYIYFLIFFFFNASYSEDIINKKTIKFIFGSCSNQNKLMKEDQYSFLKEKIKSKDFNSVFVLVDENTDKHCLDVFINKSSIEEYNKIIIKAGEENKNIDTCIQIWKELNLQKADRKTLLINLQKIY